MRPVDPKGSRPGGLRRIAPRRATAIPRGGHQAALFPQPLMAGPYNFAFVAADGAQFGSAGAGGRRVMDSVDVGPGEETSDELLFIVPPDTVADGRLAYGRMPTSSTGSHTAGGP
jgi:hypothetical protein